MNLTPLSLPCSCPQLQPITPQDRRLQECADGEKYFKIDLTTDNYGFENRWTLKTTDGDLVQKGPPDNTNYADNTRYLGGFCVAPGSYVFTVYDKFKDGMCCGTGAGSYAVELDGLPMFASPAGDEDWEIFSIDVLRHPEGPLDWFRGEYHLYGEQYWHCPICQFASEGGRSERDFVHVPVV